LFCRRGSFAAITAEMDVFTGSLIREIAMEGSIVIIMERITIRLKGRDVLVLKNKGSMK